MSPSESARSDEQERNQGSASGDAAGTPAATGKQSHTGSSPSIADHMQRGIKKMILPKVIEIAGTLGFLDKEELRKAADSLSEKYSRKITQSSTKYIRGSVSAMKIDPLELMQEVMENNGLPVKRKRQSPKTPKKSDGNVRKGVSHGR